MLSCMVQFQERGITSISSIGKNMDFGACHSWFKSNALKKFYNLERVITLSF